MWDSTKSSISQLECFSFLYNARNITGICQVRFMFYPFSNSWFFPSKCLPHVWWRQKKRRLLRYFEMSASSSVSGAAVRVGSCCLRPVPYGESLDCCRSDTNFIIKTLNNLPTIRRWCRNGEFLSSIFPSEPSKRVARPVRRVFGLLSFGHQFYPQNAKLQWPMPKWSVFVVNFTLWILKGIKPSKVFFQGVAVMCPF